MTKDEQDKSMIHDRLFRICKISFLARLSGGILQERHADKEHENRDEKNESSLRNWGAKAVNKGEESSKRAMPEWSIRVFIA